MILLSLLASLALADQPRPEVDVDRLLKVMDLPVAADRVRRAGVPDEAVDEVLRATESADLDLIQATEVMEATAEAAEESGPTDNLGEFVKDRLSEGMRGRDLAAAIRAEHVAHGKGRPEHAGSGHEDDEHRADGDHRRDGEHRADPADGEEHRGHGSDDAHGGKPPEERGEAPGRSGSREGGRPEGAGRPMSRPESKGGGR